jgi:hypothetical protein
MSRVGTARSGYNSMHDMVGVRAPCPFGSTARLLQERVSVESASHLKNSAAVYWKGNTVSRDSAGLFRKEIERFCRRMLEKEHGEDGRLIVGEKRGSI